MQALLTRLRDVCRRRLVVVVLVALALAEALSLAALIQIPSQPGLLLYGREEQVTVAPQPILKISEIRGPRIDDEAAMIVVAEPSPALPAPACFTLPGSMWALLLAAYVALLIFNLSYTFERAAGNRIQWFWEVLYTLLFVVGWYIWDECRTAVWFPFSIVKFGLLVFALYAYLSEKKSSEKREDTEKTESLF